MSILSVAVRSILAGENPFTAFKQAATQVEDWGAKIKAQLPASVQTFIDDEVASIKQGASDAISLADTLAGPFLNDAADAVNGAFVALVDPYLGPFSGVVNKAEIDMVFKLRDHLKAQLDQEALALLASRTAQVQSAPQPAAQPQAQEPATSPLQPGA